MKNRFLLLIIYLLLVIPTFSQGFQWWNEIHGWEAGMPGWPSFMIISPGYLGINALPVPTQLKGEIPLRPELELATDLHFLEGERAQNIFVRYLHPFAEGRIAVEIFGVPIENYEYNNTIRDERLSRVESGKGKVIGDLYFATHIKLLDEKIWPSVVFRMACKTASGELDGARYTDTPGYWFDLSGGKTFRFNDKFSARMFGMAGFYVWQTTSSKFLQNDAKLWGGGLEFILNTFRFEQSVQGYKGWRNEKDCPVSYRAILATKVRHSELKFEYQHGIQDVLYRSVRTAWVFKF